MPRRKATPATGTAPAAAPAVAAALPTASAGIEPPAELHVTSRTLKAGTRLHRVHSDSYAADQFNPGLKGNARFSPIKDASGAPVPTIYAATTFEAAAMESVFHDVPHAPGFKQYDKRKLQGQVHSKVQVTQDLVLADLSSKALRKLGIPRRDLIDTEKDEYPRTRRWAEAIHAQRPDVQGLAWTSRQDDSAQAVCCSATGCLTVPCSMLATRSAWSATNRPTRTCWRWPR